MNGCLYIVATPIGNLGDISQRALATLAEVSLILAEDTRTSRKLLNHYAISTKIQSFHEYNEQEKVSSLIDYIKQQHHCALISDAGTPLISDPGYRLVRAAQEAGIAVIPIPGPCAVITALCAAGLPTDRFQFEGFMAAKKGKRQSRLRELTSVSSTLIFYEAPHRILAFFQDLLEIFGEHREAVLAKELTKHFETILRAPLSEIYQWLTADEDRQRGEFVVLVHGAEESETKILPEEAIRIMEILLAELSTKQAVKLGTSITKEHKNKLYDYALKMKQHRPDKGDSQ